MGKSKQITEETLTKVARRVGIPRTTLWYAVERGAVKSRKLPLGTLLVDIADAERWVREDMQDGPGQPRKSDK